MRISIRPCGRLTVTASRLWPGLCLLLAALSLTLPAAPARAGITEAHTAFRRGDYGTAFEEFMPFARAGDALSQGVIGALYHTGKGVPLDLAEAAKWYRRAAEQGVREAQYALGTLLELQGKLVEAAQWHRRAAELGSPDAQYHLAGMYDEGRGVARDLEQAARWYRRAAEQGLAEAQAALAAMYALGEGVPQDDALAVRWDRRAAEQGHASSQFSLGLAYVNALGVEQDFAEAARWYRRAAAQGDADAQRMIGFVYFGGFGVPKDPVTAHMWLDLAAASLPPGEDRDTAIGARDLIARDLDAAQLARAQERARHWRPKSAPARATTPLDELRTDRPDEAFRIKVLQWRLASFGYDPGPIDGAASASTREAIRALQVDCGLPIDGEVAAAEKAIKAVLFEMFRVSGTTEKPLAIEACERIRISTARRSGDDAPEQATPHQPSELTDEPRQE